MSPSLSPDELLRYSRHTLLPDFGAQGQARLKAARVLIVGAGGLGSPAALYLAAAGVGTLWIDDPDPVGPGDAAAWLYSPGDLGRPRGTAAAEATRAASALVEVDILRPGARPTALLVCPGRQEVARAVAEEARLLGLPHVVAEADGEGGSVTVVPVAIAEHNDPAAREAIFDSTPVQDIMTTNPQTIGADASVRDAAQRMLYLEVHRLFVEESGKLLGVVSTTDLVRALAGTKV